MDSCGVRWLESMMVGGQISGVIDELEIGRKLCLRSDIAVAWVSNRAVSQRLRQSTGNGQETFQ